METCGMSVAKFLLFIFNLVFAISGLVILIVGAVVLAGIDDYSAVLESRVVGPPIVLIVAGLIIFVIAFLGCWGALRENWQMLIAYAILLLVICIVEFAVGITAAVVKDNVQEVVHDAMKESMTHYMNKSTHKFAWDNMQQELKCCGTKGVTDWRQYLKDEVMVTSSCCRMMQSASCNNKSVDQQALWQDGCYDKMKMKVKDGALILAGIGIGIAFVEVAGIIVALLLAYAIRNKEPEK